MRASAILAGTALAASTLIFPSCGHLVFFGQLKAHEEQHCREWKVPRAAWVYHYTREAARICQMKTGLIFVEACAEIWGDGKGGYACHIWLPPQYEGRR